MRRVARTAVLVMLVATAGCAPSVGSLGPAPTVAPVTGGDSPPPTRTPVVPSSTPSASTPRAGGPTPSVPAPTTAGPARTDALTLELWYVRDGRLEPTRRLRPVTPATSRLTLAELAAGPTSAESAAGLTTSVPAGIGITGLSDGVETLTVGASFDTGDTTTVRLREAQIVYSLTQFPSVQRVVFHRSGRPDSGPLTRADLADLLPPIVVTAPGVGETVPNPLTVTGTADVFEATVNVRVLDAAGRQLGAGFTVASCGSGCRGNFRLTLGYRLGAGQPGRIEVYEVSVRDGSRVNLVSRPVRLTAAPG